MANKTDCKGLEKNLRSAFDLSMQEAIGDGEPAEHGVSEHQFAHNFEYASEVMEDALDEVGRDTVSRCMDLDHARDILEMHWQKRHSKGDYAHLDMDVEQL